MRDAAADLWRGVAVLGMVFCHFHGAYIDHGDDWIRLYSTRWVFPLFMILAGYFFNWDGPRAGRLAQLVIVSVVSVALTVYIEMDGINIVALYTMAYALMPLFMISPLFMVGAGIVQATHPYMAFPYSGYQPGAVFALIGAGVLARRAGYVWPWPGFGEWRWIQFVGRHALAFWIGHLALMGGVQWLLNGSF